MAHDTRFDSSLTLTQSTNHVINELLLRSSVDVNMQDPIFYTVEL
jgi:hypothetical protein